MSKNSKLGINLYVQQTITISVPLISQQIRRFKASLAHLVTTAVASSVTISLFLYIFGDFLKERLPIINPTAAESLRYYLLVFLISGAVIAVRKCCIDIMFEPQGWAQYVGSITTQKYIFQRSAFIVYCFILACGSTLSFLILDYFLGPTDKELMGFELIAVIIAIVWPINLDAYKDLSDETKGNLKSHFQLYSSKDPLVIWRQQYLSKTTTTSSLLLISSTVGILIGSLAIALGKPPELSYVAFLLAGIVRSWTVAFVIKEDLRHTWLERQAAISHERWIRAWQFIFSRSSALTFVITFGLCSIATLMAFKIGQNSTSELINAKNLTQILTGSILASFPAWLAPSLILQIDGRKIFTNIIMLFLVNLFVGTAIMALPWLAPGVWLLNREAHRYQEGRFARASDN